MSDAEIKEQLEKLDWKISENNCNDYIAIFSNNTLLLTSLGLFRNKVNKATGEIFYTRIKSLEGWAFDFYCKLFERDEKEFLSNLLFKTEEKNILKPYTEYKSKFSIGQSVKLKEEHPDSNIEFGTEFVVLNSFIKKVRNVSYILITDPKLGYNPGTTLEVKEDWLERIVQEEPAE